MQQAIETILMRQLAGHLATAMVIIDVKGDLVFFNPAAERILGRRFDEVRGMIRGEWLDAVKARRADGSLIQLEDRALIKAVERDEPSHVRFHIQGLDSVLREIEGVAFPMVGQSGRKLGAVGIFWETEGAP
jgi:PAS domain S-box-containing protein